MTVLPSNNTTAYVTDKDSGDEDGWGKIEILPASMLLAPAKLENSVNNDSDHETEDDDFKPGKEKRKSVL